MEVSFSYIKSCLLNDLFSCLINELSTIIMKSGPEEALRHNLESSSSSRWPINYKKKKRYESLFLWTDRLPQAWLVAYSNINDVFCQDFSFASSHLLLRLAGLRFRDKFKARLQQFFNVECHALHSDNLVPGFLFSYS